MLSWEGLISVKIIFILECFFSMLATSKNLPAPTSTTLSEEVHWLVIYDARSFHMLSPEIEMIIREFRLSDLKRVVEIEEMSFDEPYPPSILKDIFNLGAGFLVAQEDNIIVGYIIFWIRFEDEGHIISLAVDKKYRRCTVGQKLLGMAIEMFQKFNMKNIKLEVRSENIGALKFYKTMGFYEEKIMPGYYEDGQDAVVMNLPLIKEEISENESNLWLD